MTTSTANIKAEAPVTAVKEADETESLHDFMLNLISERGDMCYEGIEMSQLADNLAFITKKRLGRNTNLDYSRLSLLLGNSQLFLLYDEILILKGEVDEDPSFAINGLLEASMAVVSKHMKQLSYPH